MTPNAAAEKAHKRHLAKRRAYYAANREKIRERDNACARKNRLLRPEQYRQYTERHKQKVKSQPAPVVVPMESVLNNPDYKKIVRAIERELRA